MRNEKTSATRMNQFNWGPGLFIIIYHVTLFIGLPLYLISHSIPWCMVAISMILMYLSGLSVTMGYHRLYAHTAYKIHPVIENILLVFGTMATQGSALRWAFDHRHHHAFVDTDQDPYSIRKGFWYAHFLWLFEKPLEIDTKVVADLARKPILVWQHRYYGWLMMATNACAFLLLGWAFNNYLEAFLFGVLLRLFVLHHLTWFINSLAHTWGARYFCKEHSAVDNYVIALLTFGEGYHNYHHTFAFDYRNGIRWYHFDPTKWLIWTLSRLGLASHLRRATATHIQEKILSERKVLLLESLSHMISDQKKEWEEKITHAVDNVMSRLKEVKRLKESYADLKKMKSPKDQLQALKLEIRKVKRSLQEESKKWADLTQDLQKASIDPLHN